jgi:two-component system chemotaxis response regulator CheB
MPIFINRSVRDSIQRGTTMTVKIAEDGEMIRDGVIYIAPSEVHLEVRDNRKIRLFKDEKVNFVCPAIDVTMNSLMPWGDDRIIGVILTGMGKDGAQGLLHIKNIGGLTIAQDEESCIVYGMPKVAYETGGVDLVLSPEQIRLKLIQLLDHTNDL